MSHTFESTGGTRTFVDADSADDAVDKLTRWMEEENELGN
jgi:hypothetical protein